jgi:hypothetical protein
MRIKGTVFYFTFPPAFPILSENVQNRMQYGINVKEANKGTSQPAWFFNNDRFRSCIGGFTGMFDDRWKIP